MIDRRSFIGGVTASAIFAPSIVRAASIMPVKGITVDISHQTGSSLSVHPIQGSLKVGDVITIEDVEAWHQAEYRYRDPCLRQFVVTAAASSGQGVIHLYPPIIPENLKFDYRGATVKSLPMRGARVTML